MTTAVIIARVSTLRQEREGLSLQDIQLPEMRDYAKSKGITVEKEFVYSETADRKIRKKFDEMIEYVKQNQEIKAIIAYRVDRITRNFRDAVAMDDLRMDFDKELHFVHDRLILTKKSVGRDITDWDIKVFMAKQTLNRLKEDAVISAQSKLRNFEWPSKAPFGYKNTTNEDKRKWIEIDEFGAKVVLKMYEWYSTASFSIRLIRNKLKEDFNLDFSNGFVDKILNNPFYCGTMIHNEKEYPHKYDLVISRQLYDKVQEVKAGYHKKHFKFAGLPYHYRGLIRCADCGCMITPEKKKGKYVYYHCTQYNGKHATKWLREEDLTKQFSDVFKGLQMPREVVEDITQSLREAHKDKSHFHRSILEGYQTEYQKYEERIEKMYEDKLDGRITDDYYDQKRQEYRAKQKELQDKMTKLHYADEEYYITADYLLQLASRAYELFESSEVQEKRQLLKLTLQNLKLEGSLVRYDLLKPFDKIALFASRQQWLPREDSNLQPRS